jgi:hypothetical protein
MNPAHLWKLKTPMMAYAKWYAGRRLLGITRDSLGHLPTDLRRHAEYASGFLSNSCFDISAMMRTYQLKLADRQCRMAQASARVQNAVIMLVTSLYGAQSDCEIARAAADVLCTQLTHRIQGTLPSDKDFRKVTQLGATIANDGWSALHDAQKDEILMKY